ncbi:MAG TPA: acyltransferase [Luteibaculaceae bacterium]|nr:acyltransferase [Luteibaculaceae bacterium]
MKSAQVNPDSPQRIFGLDLYRAIAIIWVVMSHGGFLLNTTPISGFPFFKTIDGVDLFFVLSGFLIGGILLRSLQPWKAFGWKAVLQFWKRRWFRTLPNYYLILLVNVVFVSTGIIREDITQFNWKFFFFLQNFSSPFFGFFWESWSLAVEEWFYIITPLVLSVLLRFLPAKQSFLAVSLLLMVFPLCYRISILDPQVDGFWYDSIFRKLVLTRLDSIAFGLAAAWIYFYYPEQWARYRGLAAAIGLVAMVFVVRYQPPIGSFYKQALYFSLTPLASVLLIPWAQGMTRASGWWARAITHISKISYSMYLINLALVAEVIRDHFMPTGAVDGMVLYAVYWLVVIGASTLLYRYFERPVMNLRDR